MGKKREYSPKKRFPGTTYKTKYPSNKVFQTESGHQFEIDDTPGATRIRVAHKSGSYYEIHDDGSITSVSVGNHHHYAKGGTTFTIDQNADLKFVGSQRIAVSGDSYIETKGDSYASVAGDMIAAVNGSHVSSVKGNSYSKIGGNHTSKTDGDHNAQVMGSTTIKTEGDSLIKTKGDSTINAEGKINIQSKGDKNIKSEGNLTIEATKNLIMKGQSVVSEATGGTNEVKASGEVKTQGSSTKLQGGGASSPPITVS